MQLFSAEIDLFPCQRITIGKNSIFVGTFGTVVGVAVAVLVVVGSGVAVIVGVEVAVDVGVGDAVGLPVGVGVGLDWGVAVFVGVGVAVDVAVLVGVGSGMTMVIVSAVAAVMSGRPIIVATNNDVSIVPTVAEIGTETDNVTSCDCRAASKTGVAGSIVTSQSASDAASRANSAFAPLPG